MSVRIIAGDCREVLATMPEGSARCCVTSPPYYGLRDYDVAGQIGMEDSPEDYVAALVSVLEGVRRALSADGTLWLNLGDSYASGGRTWRAPNKNGMRSAANAVRMDSRPRDPEGIKPKDLLGIPWRVAFGLQASGWYLRSAIVWAKPNPMPESVNDRPTSAYEMLFLFAKSERYHYDAQAVAEPSLDGTRNARNVWNISTSGVPDAHFAVMSPEMAERCIRAGSRPGDHILDPFGGAGTTGLVADRLGRDATLIELNPDYVRLAENRIRGDAPLFAEIAT